MGKKISEMSPEELLEQMTLEQKEAVYRKVRAEYVADDIKSYTTDNPRLSDIQEDELKRRIDAAAELYANGRYDDIAAARSRL